ncbi:SDR family oxidoreductase [Marinifilum caeruleilacunae]|uniref:SDR family oxidoreductase n=1 Tax=Marinifilum caeruleilacunae TaxID=2499076 RepID=A0ABX1WQZ8_9BACT|nr:SDR family oxidoreductase [Marinifilum caeruleilacunae]NOU58369.1 SDR family oxidoreductase [Marinifilum caeruleilacunae]
MRKTVIITGTSSGFGKLSAKKFQQEGWNVIATMRNPEKETELHLLDHVLLCQLDVADNQSIKKAIAEGIKHFGKIDVLVNNAGYVVAGVTEEIPEEDIRRQFDVNLFGALNTMKAILPHFRANKSGTIINVSSVGGKITTPFMAVYQASKFAIEGLTEAMQYELNPFNIKLKLIEPGAFNTNLGTSMSFTPTKNESDYKNILDKAMAGYAKWGEQQQNPQEVADAIFSACTDGTEQFRYPVGADAIQILAARNQMDDVEFKSMIAQTMDL